jgi:TetR/AcrR family transcriptional regulator
MASTKKARPEDMRARILEEATRRFGDHGFGETSIDSIAAAVGIRKPSLLYHFSTKEKLRQEVVQNMMERWKEDLPRLLTAASGGHDRFESMITAVIDFYLDDPTRARLSVREAMDRPDSLKKLLKEHLQPWIALITDYIRWGKKTGICREDVDPEAYVIHVLLLAISMTAFTPVAEAIANTSPKKSLVRQKKELVRMAREGLFVNGSGGEAKQAG